MKFTEIETVSMDATNAGQYLSPNKSPAVYDFAKLLLTYAQDGITLTEYHYIEAGNLLSDNGLVAVISETLSMNDNHTVSEDVEYFNTTCGTGEYSYACMYLYRDGVLNVLYFIHS